LSFGTWKFSAAFLLLAVLTPSLVSSQETPGPNKAQIKKNLSQNKKRLAEIQKRLEIEQQKLKQTQAKEAGVLTRLQETDQTLGRLRKEAKTNQQDLQETRLRLGQLQREMRENKGRLGQSREVLENRLRALYRVSFRKPYLGGILASESFGDLARRLKFEMLLARSNEKLVSQTLRHKTELEENSNEWNSEERRQKRILGDLGQQEKKVTGEQKKRKNILVSLRREKAIQKQTLEDLRASARELNGKVAILLNQQATLSPSEKVQGKGLEVSRGAIPWPVSGRIISPFGPYLNPEFNAVVDNTGIQIQAALGSPFKAVSDGTVGYADWLKGYGKVVILDHGRGYYSIYAQASELNVAKGQEVREGQTLGAVGDAGSLVGSSLYFEIRKNGIPQDPVRWLKRHK